MATPAPAANTTSNDHGSRVARAEGAYEQKFKEEKVMKAQNYEKALAKASEESKLLYSAGIFNNNVCRHVFCANNPGRC